MLMFKCAPIHAEYVILVFMSSVAITVTATVAATDTTTTATIRRTEFIAI
jgi:hypothetical protein